MIFSVSNLLAGFVFGVFGFWMIREARQKANYPILFIGMALLIYPYFTPNAFLTWGIGFTLCALAYKLW